MEDPQNHRYPSYEGMLSFRTAVADWYKERFGVELDPKTEVVALIGSKEGIAHTPLAFLDPGDIGLYTDPGYPVYPTSISFAGRVPYAVPLLKENGFLPDLGSIPGGYCKESKDNVRELSEQPDSGSRGRGLLQGACGFCRQI